MEDQKIVTLTSDKDVLITHRNAFQKTLLDNILDLKRHEYIKTIKPDYQRKNQQGKYEDINDLIEQYKKQAANAKSYVEIIDALLAKETEGTLATEWSEISEEEKEENKESGPKVESDK